MRMRQPATKKKKEEKRQRVVLLDTHAILHRAYHALPDFTSPAGEPTGALYGLAAMLMKILTELKPDYLVAAYDLPKPTYRHEAFKEYKAKRPKTDEELGRQIERSHQVFEAFDIPIYSAEGFEADDILGTLTEELKKNGMDSIIASGDMDTLQLVDDDIVRVYTLKKGIQDTMLYSEKDVVERFGFGPELLPDFKGLRGDPSDNIPGIRGIGEKTATTLVTTFGGIDDMYKKLGKDKKAFEKAGITPRIIKLLEEGKEEAEFSKLLATIRRDAPVTFTVPKKTWKETFDTAKALALFNELGFRSLVVRLKERFGDVGEKEAVTEAGQMTLTPEELSEEERREIKVALWVLDSDLTNPSDDDVRAYAKTESLKEAREKIFKELEKTGLMRVFKQIEQPLIPIVAAMTTRGVKLDTSYLAGLSETYHRDLAAIEKRIWERAGGEFNINSPKQLGEVLYEKLGLSGKKKTPTGQRSTREEELLTMRDAHPVIDDVLKYRELQKLLSTYIDAFARILGPDGRLHATFVQTGTTTGRMSSQNPNLQNIPIKTELGRAVRGAFVSEKGYALVTCDYSQIELRIAAILSGDEKLMRTFEEGGDIHRAVAAEMNDVAPEDVTPDMRRTAKVINFGIIYGMGANALAHTAGITRSQAQEYLAEYARSFPQLMTHLDRVKSEARKKGYTETLFGRRRNLPGLRSSLPHIRAEAERQAVNAPIQGTNADIIKIAIIDIEEFVKEKGWSDGVRLVLQIHDELVYEVRDDLVDDVVPEIRRMMESVVSSDQSRGVPITVEVAIGKRWSEMKPIER